MGANSAKAVRRRGRKAGSPYEVVVIALADGHASTAVGAFEVFGAAGVAWQQIVGEEVRPRFNVKLASVDGKPVQMSDGLLVKPEYALRDVSSVDLVFISSGGSDIDALIRRNGRVIEFVRLSHDQGACIAAVCSGVATLAAAGILDGAQATTHWSLVPEFANRFPKTLWNGQAIVTEGRRVYCGGGVYAALDLATHLVEKYTDRTTAVECAKALMFEMPRSRQPEFGTLGGPPESRDRQISRAQQMIHRGVTKGIRLEEIAGKVGMSPRNFIRRFKHSVGVSPVQYLQRVRIDLAKRLIEEGSRTAQELAWQVGYSDLAHFRRIFKRETGVSISEYRRSIGPSRKAKAA